MTLASHVRTLGRGPGRARSLTMDEAHDAMQHMLMSDADQAATGALLMLLRMKGETAEEIAGLSAAAQAHVPTVPQADLDWPSYAAGRTRGLPWFLLSARLVAEAGFRVFLHGWNGPDGSVRNGIHAVGIPQARNTAEAAQQLDTFNITYIAQESLMPKLFGLLALRDKLGLRSCINTVSRMVNPARAAACVQGVFHPSYRLLQADVAALLGCHSLSVIKGGGGEFERNPAKSIEAFGLRDGLLWQSQWPATRTEKLKLVSGPADNSTLSRVWSGQQEDAFARDIVVGTAAAALATLGTPNAEIRATQLWDARRRHAVSVKETLQ